MNRFVRFGLAAIILLTAPVLFLQGQANAGNVNSPAFSLNGFNMAELSRATLRVQQQGASLALGVDEAGVALARRAFAAEPFATNALFVLAVEERSGGDRARADALLGEAVALDKRNRFLGALELEQQARAGNFPATFAVIDRLAVVQPTLSREFVAPLVASLGQDGAIDVVKGALDAEPVWANAFWMSVPPDPALVGRMYELRRQTSAGTSPESDAALLAALARQGRYADAFAFRATLPGAGSDPFGFVAAGGNPPFGWDTVASGERSMAPQGENGYAVFVQADTHGELARQLVRLTPGSYTFSAAIEPAAKAEGVSVQLVCATTGAELSEQPLTADARWSVPGGCEAWWLVLNGSAWAKSDALRVTVSDMTLTAAN